MTTQSNITQSTYMGTPLNYMGSVNSASDLPAPNIVGQMFFVQSTTDTYISDGTNWQLITASSSLISGVVETTTILDVLTDKCNQMDIKWTGITDQEIFKHPLVVSTMNDVLASIKKLEMSVKLVQK